MVTPPMMVLVSVDSCGRDARSGLQGLGNLQDVAAQIRSRARDALPLRMRYDSKHLNWPAGQYWDSRRCGTGKEIIANMVF
jgi:hypothetical protein